MPSTCTDLNQIGLVARARRSSAGEYQAVRRAARVLPNDRATAAAPAEITGELADGRETHGASVTCAPGDQRRERPVAGQYVSRPAMKIRSGRDEIYRGASTPRQPLRAQFGAATGSDSRAPQDRTGPRSAGRRPPAPRPFRLREPPPANPGCADPELSGFSRTTPLGSSCCRCRRPYPATATQRAARLPSAKASISAAQPPSSSVMRGESVKAVSVKKMKSVSRER